MEIRTNNPEQTVDLARQIGSRLRGGECFELTSDLGGGKTTFTRGLVAGAGSRDQVASPTFTIGKQYTSDKLRMYHFDFYRLQEPGLVAEELAEAITDENGVIIVEWAQTVQSVLPADRLAIELRRVADDEDARILKIDCPEQLQYVCEGLSS